MKYYIDFEATESRHEIISIGCIREDGEEFYSLVYSDDPVTPKIEELTGISQEDVNEAPSSKEVFESFYDWCSKNEEVPEFINYGSSDVDFVYSTYLNASSIKEASILSFLYMNMYDCSEDLKQFFYANKTISLEKLGKYFNKDMDDQNHNALDDAKLLKMVYDKMKTGDRNFDAFLEYVDPKKYPDEVRKVLRLKNNEVVEEYANMKEAVAWAKAQPNYKGVKYVQNIDEKIKYAAKNQSKYFECYWRII
ncbi:MAG: 3'-5' exoribonuclease [Erysipelotrichaceae bacterium]|nr:3'-5' exoribonuclease [Erysipelotrichaceae bacterium]